MAGTRFFEHDGHRLAFEVHGDSDRVLVYLHGLLLDAGLNRAIARSLAERGNQVVLLDLLGHGRSDKPAHASEYRMDLYVDQVFALLDELGVDQAALGGLSLGANVSLLAAVARPDRVRGLVLEMPVLERAAPSVALTFVPLLLALHYARLPVRLLSRVARRVPRSGFGPLDSLVHAVSAGPESSAAVLHGVLLGPVTPTVEQREALKVPALVLAHRADLIHPFSDATALVRQLPDAQLLSRDHHSNCGCGLTVSQRRSPPSSIGCGRFILECQISGIRGAHTRECVVPRDLRPCSNGPVGLTIGP